VVPKLLVEESTLFNEGSEQLELDFKVHGSYEIYATMLLPL
jgi:hypothetical protein